MSNRILKDTIWDSPTLAELPEFAEYQYPRWLLLADDWGCFCADVETIKGKVYPRRPTVTAAIVEDLRLAYYRSGLLFCWMEDGRTWGYWTNFGEHNYVLEVEHDGSRKKGRRRTPTPPADLLTAYLAEFKTTPKKTVTLPGWAASVPPIAPPLAQNSTSFDNVRQESTAFDKSRKLELELDSKLELELEGSSPKPTKNTNFQVSAPVQKPGALDEAFEIFVKIHNDRRKPANYPRTDNKGDFVQLAALRKANNLEARASPENWITACENYFASPLASYTLADLCRRYAVFVKSKLDRFNKPVDSTNETTSDISGGRPERNKQGYPIYIPKQ